MTVTLEQYEQAERELTLHEAKVGLRVHAIVTVVVVVALVIVNVFVAPEFPWSAIVAGGMGLGLLFHWFGYRSADVEIRERQDRVEARARELTHV